MYTIANKNNKKTRKISSSSRNKHKSKSKNKHKHKYTIGKTRKYTKSYFNLQNGGVTFQDFKTTIQTLFGKFTPDSPDSPDSKYTPDKLFFHLTIAATSITAPDQQKKALHIIQTMYIFYSNQFTPNANSPLRKTITRKYPTIKVTPLTTKPTLLTTDLGEDLSTVIYDKLTAAAKKHTVHATLGKILLLLLLPRLLLPLLLLPLPRQNGINGTHSLSRVLAMTIKSESPKMDQNQNTPMDIEFFSEAMVKCSHGGNSPKIFLNVLMAKEIILNNSYLLKILQRLLRMLAVGVKIFTVLRMISTFALLSSKQMILTNGISLFLILK